MIRSLFYFLLIFFSLNVLGQNHPVLPASFSGDFSSPPQIEIRIQAPRDIPAEDPQPLFAGFLTGLSKEELAQGRWQQTPEGELVWQIRLRANGAAAVNLYLQTPALRPGERLFVYADRQSLQGPFGPENNSSYLVTDFLPGETLTLELNTPYPDSLLPFQSLQLGVASGETLRDFGDSEFCEVPVNCPEGDAWQNEKRGVARVLVKEGSSLWWCTGSLVNNTAEDRKPLFLTANHCGRTASAADYAAWRFYFEYESDDCNRPPSAPAAVTLTGSKLLAKAVDDTDTGSDFKLLLITAALPAGFTPWYNGWDRTGSISPSGVSIHHPEGDIKMISTYTEAVVSTTYSGTVPDPGGLFWQVHWALTVSGQGVTEPGSSGSPLFDPSGNIIGCLTGGKASCDLPGEADYYGKFSSSWAPAGSDSAGQLKYWLDPLNTGAYSFSGNDWNNQQFYADFSADFTQIMVGETVTFTNLSSNDATVFQWTFPGGEPSSYQGMQPPPVRYPTAGSYDVQLLVSNADNTDTELKKTYIRVRPSVFPNPSPGKFTVMFGTDGFEPESLDIKAYDLSGRQVGIFVSATDDPNAVTVDLSTQRRGLYLLRVVTNNSSRILKAVVSK